jgi:hypothetical protein
MAFNLRSLYRRLRFGEPIIIVSGLPRSGTSMAMKMLEATGYPIVSDGIRTADEDNPKGYYELERVKDLAKEDDFSWLADAKGRAIKIISYLLKELPPDYNYKVLFMRRDLSEVLASQQKMLQRRDETSETEDERMVELYENDLWKANYLLKHQPHFEHLEVYYRQVLDEPLQAARQINEFLGGNLDVEKMAGVVDPDLYRNRAEKLADKG